MDPGLGSHSHIKRIVREELTLKVKCVFAYGILMIVRVILTLLQRDSVAEYYEYVFCACFMSSILILYKTLSLGGLTDNNVAFLNTFIPVVIIFSATWHMESMEAVHFESQEAWAFC